MIMRLKMTIFLFVTVIITSCSRNSSVVVLGSGWDDVRLEIKGFCPGAHCNELIYRDTIPFGYKQYWKVIEVSSSKRYKYLYFRINETQTIMLPAESFRRSRPIDITLSGENKYLEAFLLKSLSKKDWQKYGGSPRNE
ncbi:hypothetical protein A3850_002415 [Lewinella sp. 4G2]|nr:hypothetical protein A3850_002415 [Lewinella sp. 4G2]